MTIQQELQNIKKLSSELEIKLDSINEVIKEIQENLRMVPFYFELFLPDDSCICWEPKEKKIIYKDSDYPEGKHALSSSIADRIKFHSYLLEFVKLINEEFKNKF